MKCFEYGLGAMLNVVKLFLSELANYCANKAKMFFRLDWESKAGTNTIAYYENE
jgi:hypothetical protein